MQGGNKSLRNRPGDPHKNMKNNYFLLTAVEMLIPQNFFLITRGNRPSIKLNSRKKYLGHDSSLFVCKLRTLQLPRLSYMKVHNVKQNTRELVSFLFYFYFYFS